MKKWWLLSALLPLLAVQTPAKADPIPLETAKQQCAKVDVGARTPYGETKAEVEAKKIAFLWACGVLVEGKVKESFEKYVSKDFCDHSHMANSGFKDCANYDETLKVFERMTAMLVKDGKVEFPVVSTVNGELVTQYGEGVDIFRVHNGKLTDHWDASPAIDRNLKAHDKEFADRMQKQIDTGKPQGAGFGPGADVPAGAAKK